MNEVFPEERTMDRFVPKQASASMRINSEAVSKEIDESDLQYEKHDERRIQTSRGMTISDLLPRYRSNLMFNECEMKSDSVKLQIS
jgi:hypothetical protein